MKEQIYTIPVNEVYETDFECPLCELEKRLEREARLREIKELELKQAHEMYKAELESLKSRIDAFART